MKVVFSRRDLPKKYKGAVMTLGNFDGIHLGHRDLINKTVEKAKAIGKPALILSFEPHPVKVLHPERGFRELFPVEDLIEQLDKLQVDVLVIETFDLEMAQMEPQDFINQVLLESIAPSELIVGYDFHFGKDRKGDFHLMKEVLKEHGIPVQQVQPLKFAAGIVSSTAIREALLEGHVEKASELLGRPFELRGHIVGGDQRGRRLNFPTANMDVENEIVPRVGVYLTHFKVGDRIYPGLTNIGYRPTFDDQKSPQRLSVETFLIDQHVDLYEEHARIQFLKWLRPEIKFASPEQLVQQIQKDVATARNYFAKL